MKRYRKDTGWACRFSFEWSQTSGGAEPLLVSGRFPSSPFTEFFLLSFYFCSSDFSTKFLLRQKLSRGWNGLLPSLNGFFYYFYWVLLGFTGFFSGFLAELMTLNVADAPFQQVLTGTTCGRLCGFELVLPSFILCFLILVSEFS